MLERAVAESRLYLLKVADRYSRDRRVILQRRRSNYRTAGLELRNEARIAMATAVGSFLRNDLDPEAKSLEEAWAEEFGDRSRGG